MLHQKVKNEYWAELLDGISNYVVASENAMKDTTISLKIERSLKAKLLIVSRRENRSLSNFVEKLIKEEIAKYESKHGRIKFE